MKPTPLILLPPSEGKFTGGEGPSLDFDALSFSSLNPTRAIMAQCLKKICERPDAAQKLLGVKGTFLKKTIADNLGLAEAPSCSAIQRYTGVMYDAIDYQSLDPRAREAFDRTVVIMSGLFGITRPNNMIPSYKLKMGARLMGDKTCAAVWRPLISKALGRTYENSVIWDLLPIEHSAAWDSSVVPHKTRFTVKFVARGAHGKLRTVSHWSKALKGALVRHLILNISEAESRQTALGLVAGFSHREGYEFCPEMTEEVDKSVELVFVKAD